ncbi:MAG TPA: GntR family transcriptional regulator [Vicinamibacteria bacterium]|jgi:GntR family transcriptional regulator|nr:GntR family transcriptional regulator [Vicinamibacteria bacterium]HRB12792.1 GntR family transcriptional regulator [Vicinamibacteria bacterium]
MTPPKADPWMNRIQVLPADPRPIWSQIEEGLRRLLASGSLAPGDTVPSVRELATELRVNPATVSKAYQRLVGAGLMEVRRGDGTYVSAAPPAVRKSEQTRVIRQAAMNFASVAITHGAELDTAREALDLAWDELSNSEGGNR